MTQKATTGAISNDNTAPYGFEPLLDSKEAAALLHVHHKTLERKARQGVIPGHRRFNRWYFRASELDCWIRSEVDSPGQSARVN